MAKQIEKTGNRRQVKVRAQRLTKNHFGMPTLDDLRPAFDPLPELPDGPELIARQDRDWLDDERTIEALARHLGLSAIPADDSRAEIELERLWKLPHHAPELVEWRRRAWFYRRVLVRWAQSSVPGFRRQPTPGETRPVRWSRIHFQRLLDVVYHAKKILEKASRPAADVDALRFLLVDNPDQRGKPFFRADMKLANAKKLLARARGAGELSRR